MLFSVEFLDFILYCVQQLGVVLAVGAATVVLVSYLTSMRDGKLSEREEHFARAIKRVLGVGLGLIVLSGIAITLVHLSLGESAIVFLPAFDFKWILITGLAVAYVLKGKKAFWSAPVEGAIGGSWYALFLIHIMAPVVSWGNIIALYALWMLGFMLCFSAAVFFVTGVSPFPKRKIIPKPPKPVAPAPIIQPQIVKVEIPISKPKAPEPPPPPAPVAPVALVPAVVADTNRSHWLPAVHVMPKTREDLEQNKHIIPAAMNINPSIS